MPLTLNGTTGIAGIDGSAATPSVQGGDTNTGIFYPAADTIAFAEGGTEVMRIASSGNVGVGTSSPAVKLAVSSTDAVLLPVGTTAQRPTGATGYIRFNSTTTAFEGYDGSAWESIGQTGPAFHASAGGAQTVSSTVNTKITLTEDFDTNADFASSRFTPTVAGYYQINGAVWFNAATSASYAGVLIYKNGASYSLNYASGYTSTSGSVSVSDIVYLNGSTDYVELYGRASGTGTLTITANTFFSGCLIRGA